MRGCCPRCKEYRSDDGRDAWGIIWRDGLPFCAKCLSLIDMPNGECEEKDKTGNSGYGQNGEENEDNYHSGMS